VWAVQLAGLLWLCSGRALVERSALLPERAS
jgi:hypothetical protein